MSAAHDAHGASAHAHDDHFFDGEPAHELSPGEPRTPGWLPVLGLFLFALAAVWLLAAGSGDAPAAPAGEPVAAKAAPEPVAVAAPARPAPSPPPPAASGGALGRLQALSPEKKDELMKRIDKARAAGILPKRGEQPAAH